MRVRLLFGCLLAVAVFALPGCGGSSQKFAPVSGRVTMKGQPLAGAAVTFMPIVPEGGAAPGPNSVAKTDENGEFTLETTTGEPGALVGPHRVHISLTVGGTSGDERRPVSASAPTEKIAPEFNANTKLTFDVPPGG